MMWSFNFFRLGSNKTRREGNDSPTATSDDAFTKRKPAGRTRKSFARERGPRVSQTKRLRESFEMVKRRARMPIAMFDRPLVSEVEYIVDERYHSLKVIGYGSFGVVASAIDSRTSQRVAIKKILGAFSSSKMARYVLREVRLLRHLKHAHIVRLLDIDVPRQYRAWDEVYIVTPLLRTDLSNALKEGLVETPVQQKKIAYQILSALDHMHALGLMHRDVKAKNIILDDELNAQLCDLGHSRFYSKANRDLDLEFDDQLEKSDEPGLSTSVITPIQSPPEIGLGIDYDATIDIWAAGCVIAQIVQPGHEGLFDRTGRQAHLAEILTLMGNLEPDDLEDMPDHAQSTTRKIAKGGKKNSSNDMASIIRSRLGANSDPLVVDLLEQMLQFSPRKRVSASRALEHPWFDGVRQVQEEKQETFNFGRSEPHRKATKAELKELVWQEVVAFHPEAANHS